LSAVLVTGASGFAGSHLVDLLMSDGTTPIVGWHGPDRPPAASPPPIEWRGVELRDAGAIDREIAALRPSVVYHVAGVPRVDTSWRSVVPHLQINVMGTHHLLQAIKRHAVNCRVLVISSGLVYRPSPDPVDEFSACVPANPYALSKLAQDHLSLRAAHDDGLDLVVARPFNHIGPRQEAAFAIASFARQIALAEAGRIEPTIRVGNVDTRRDLTDVRDVVRAYRDLVAQGARGEAYNVCSGQAVRIGDVLDHLLRAATVKIAIQIDRDRMRAEDTPVVVGSPERIRAATGWAPTHTLRQTLEDTLDWWRAAAGQTFA
jgi:GDP-4-dehydro-6-deoxy-D-mannose reductase